MENEKKRRLEKRALAKKGAEVLEEIEKNSVDVLSNKMKKCWMEALLAWYGIEATQDCRKIVDRRKKWAEVRTNAPPLHPQWTEEDEAKLVDKKKFNICRRLGHGIGAGEGKDGARPRDCGYEHVAGQT